MGGEQVMVCLISRQTMQNLLPILQLEPQRVVFISTQQEDQSRQQLEAVLAQRSVQIDAPHFVDAYTPDDTQRVCRQLVAQFGAERLIANITGGTKVMSLAAYQVFAGAGVPCVYTDTPNRRLLYLYPEARAPEPLLSRVDVLTYLQAHGQHVALRQPTSRRSLPELARFIGQYIIQVNPFLSRMRLAMRQARGTRTPNRIRFDLKGSQRHAKAAELLKRCMQAGLVQAEQGGKSEVVLTFDDDAARRYLEGEWLEDLVFDTVRRNRFDEVATNVALFWQDNPEREMNEIDVAVVHNLRFFYISCKSGGDAAQMKHHVYELESLAELTGGVFNHPILVASSSKAVPAYLQRRMAALGMTYLGPKALPDLASHLKTIIR